VIPKIRIFAFLIQRMSGLNFRANIGGICPSAVPAAGPAMTTGGSVRPVSGKVGMRLLAAEQRSIELFYPDTLPTFGTG
jgi:hypothetical protein